MTTHYKKGDLIKKASGGLFKFNTFRGKPILSPYDTVRGIQPSKDAGSIYINGDRYYEPNQPIIISQIEANELYKEWERISKIIPSISNRKHTEFEHIREDNGEEKVAYLNKNEARKVLWQYSQKFPEKKFELYICSVCGGIHMGKTIEE